MLFNKMDEVPIYEISGIKIHGFANLDVFAHYLVSPLKTGILVAINAEKVMTALQDQQLARLIQQAEYKYADGISIVKAIQRKYTQILPLKRITGADLWFKLMQIAGQHNLPVFLIGGKPDVLQEVKDKLMPWKVNIVGSCDGYFSSAQQVNLIQHIKASGAKLVTVALGSPKQEIFMADCQKIYPEALYMGVGGTYDVFTGRIKRAPLSWQKLGLEWLYRLLKQPTRWQRQLKLFKFLFYYYTNRL